MMVLKIYSNDYEYVIKILHTQIAKFITINAKYPIDNLDEILEKVSLVVVRDSVSTVWYIRNDTGEDIPYAMVIPSIENDHTWVDITTLPNNTF